MEKSCAPEAARVKLVRLSALAQLRADCRGRSGIYPEREAVLVAARWLIPIEAAREIVLQFVAGEDGDEQGRLPL